MNQGTYDVVVIGAGIVGIATVYYLKKFAPKLDVALVDRGIPMALTSAQSGENYRNWWPHPVMTAFTDRSIDLMEEIARETNNRINLTRRGYVLATRSANTDVLMQELEAGYAESSSAEIRIHDQDTRNSFQSCNLEEWHNAPDGVDVINDRHLIQKLFPFFDQSISNLVHIRRAGDLDSQQLGQYMLEVFQAAGGRRLTGKVIAIKKAGDFQLEIEGQTDKISASQLVNAAGPFMQDIAGMLETQLPVKNVLQQKIAFEDSAGAIPRGMPFSIDLDEQWIDWSDEEKTLLRDDSELSWVTEKMQGAIHCRPTGGDRGKWVKLGWAFNQLSEQADVSPELSTAFPEIVVRGAARLNPALKTYYEKLPANLHHYGGYYTMTEENWPLVGSTNVSGCYVVGALSGFGTMAACAAGELCALWVTDGEKPDYATALSPQRYDDSQLMNEIHALSNRGIL